MTKTFQIFAKLAMVFALATTSGAQSAEAQRKAPSVEPGVAETVKQQQAPRIGLPQKQQPAPAAPQAGTPIQVDISSNRVRLPGSRLSPRQRKQLAETLAQQAVAGVGGPTFVEYDKLQVAVPRKIETSFAGHTSLTKGIGLVLLASNMALYHGGRGGFVPASLGVDIVTPANRDIDYFLVDIHYNSAPIGETTPFYRENEEDLRPQMSIRYALNDLVRTDEVPILSRSDGVFTILVDPDSAIFSTHSADLETLWIRGAGIRIRAIEVRPVQ